ncbi:MAG: hypothetical protein RL104_361 [Bacteroidota bacterium]|jgi:hypothetical protein
MAEPTPRVNVTSVLRGSFLGHPYVVRNLPFVAYLSALGMIAIFLAHRAEQNARTISEQSAELSEIKSEYLEAKSTLMRLGTESSVRERAQLMGLVPPTKAPERITIPKDDAE